MTDFTIKLPSAKTVGVALRNIVAALVVALTIMGSILFVQVHNETNQIKQEAVIAKKVAREAVASAVAAQKRSGMATCKALIQLDKSADGINFSPPTKTGTAELYVIRFTANLHHLVVVTGCEK